MAIKYLILLSRQGKVRLAKWFTTLSPKEKAKIIKDVSQLVLARRTRMCNFLEYKDIKIVYRRYASLFFIAGCDSTDNELITLEVVHRYVEQMDKYYGNVCELDIIFNFQKAYFILDELLLAGEMQESSKKNVLRVIGQQDSLEDMEYVPLQSFETVASALNFETPDCHVTGGCDLYTTKATGADKKLYKTIESTIESQHESLVRLSASISPPYKESLAESIRASRASPFGNLGHTSSRRTFAYLIATLNASHPDYDFSHILRPTDFRQEKSLSRVIATIDSTLGNLRPRLAAYSPSAALTLSTGGSKVWGPRMWKIIDEEMNLRQCSIYCYTPEEDPFDGEDAAIWSLAYFFFNRPRKRVCYLHLRGMSAMSQSPVYRPSLPIGGKREASPSGDSVNDGARKRARFWFGDRAKHVSGGWADDEGEAETSAYGARHGDGDEDWDIREIIEDGYATDYDYEDESDYIVSREASAVRAMSEHAVESMEI
ncbi:MAG: hypothetical protein M1821_007199 [Bathelium mastoideum]|nr:MAG: hypothetical protein M1821_007199 [Bathelium mastoideum]